MSRININAFIFRSLISFSTIASHLSIVEIISVSAQSSQTDRGIECLKKYTDFYYANTGLNRTDSLKRAEEMCSKQNESQGNGKPTILVIPQDQSVQSQPTQRRTKKQCVNKMLNTVWDDVHCQYNNVMFEWKTIYLD